MQYGRCRYELFFFDWRQQLQQKPSFKYFQFKPQVYFNLLLTYVVDTSSPLQFLRYLSFVYFFLFRSCCSWRKKTNIPSSWTIRGIFIRGRGRRQRPFKDKSSIRYYINPLESEVRTGRARPSLCRAKQLRTSLLCRGLDASPSHRYSSLPSPVVCPFFTRVEGDDKINQW